MATAVLTKAIPHPRSKTSHSSEKPSMMVPATRLLSLYTIRTRNAQIQAPKELIHFVRRHEILTVHQTTLRPDTLWYGLRVIPGYEMQVQKQLQDDGYTVHLPLGLDYRVRTVTPEPFDPRRTTFWVWRASESLRVKPVLAGYVFVAGEALSPSTPAWMHQIAKPQNVKREHVIGPLLTGEDKLTSLTSDELAQVDATPGYRAPFRPGFEDPVRVAIPGPHYGLVGTVAHATEAFVWITVPTETVHYKLLHTTPTTTVQVERGRCQMARYLPHALVFVMDGPHQGQRGLLTRDTHEALTIWCGKRLPLIQVSPNHCAVVDVPAPFFSKRPMTGLEPAVLESLGMAIYDRETGLLSHQQETLRNAIALIPEQQRNLRTLAYLLNGISYDALSRSEQTRFRRAVRGILGGPASRSQRSRPQ